MLAAAAVRRSCIGSFLNVCIYRLPLRQVDRVAGVALPARAATRCAWYENIPVVSWLVLRGRCRTCRAPISMQYPIVELITAALFVLVVLADAGRAAARVSRLVFGRAP